MRIGWVRYAVRMKSISWILQNRDAWVAFAKVHYPNTDANAWLTLLTTNRVLNLRANDLRRGLGHAAWKPR